ncbi:MAG: hypothetical protein QOF05_608 [Sphingomonadales bacterium]|jgi:hypothetical protein|nr:hypothetical protein [Sphingomonadales bacterium]
MADALPLTPLLLMVVLIAVAAAPAAAEPRIPKMQMHSVDAGGFDKLTWARRDPVFGPRFAQEEALPTWTLPFAPSDGHDRRGLSFGVRPQHGLKAMMRFRF